MKIGARRHRLNGAPVFDDRFGAPVLRRVLISARGRLIRDDARVAMTRRAHDSETEDGNDRTQ
jgi:hypothetical protein